MVINSAGQDNHYSDPLADMSFTAQGYAVLNRKLRPDIAVLEGGYSVETALPYINMGIIMAMAGIDFSNLREPDYKPGGFVESPKNMDYIKSLVETQLANFRGREAVVEKNRESERDFESTTKSIFYDTDYLHEEQRVDLRLCPDCCGFRRIESTAVQATGRRYSVFCISLPHACCPACAGQARGNFEDLKFRSKYDYVYLQDRIEDEFRIFDRTTEQETVL